MGPRGRAPAKGTHERNPPSSEKLSLSAIATPAARIQDVVRNLRRGETLWEQGEPANQVCVLEKGSLGVYLPDGSREEFVYVSGMVAGATGLLSLFGSPSPRRTARIEARALLVQVRCYDPEEIQQAFERGETDVAVALLRSLLAHVLYNWTQVVLKGSPQRTSEPEFYIRELESHSARLLPGTLTSWAEFGRLIRRLHALRELSRDTYRMDVVEPKTATHRAETSARFFKQLFEGVDVGSPPERFHRHVVRHIEKLPLAVFTLKGEGGGAKILASPSHIKTPRKSLVKTEGPAAATAIAKAMLRDLQNLPDETRRAVLYILALRGTGELEDTEQLKEIVSAGRRRLREVFKGPTKSFTINVIKGRRYVYEQWRGSDGKTKTRYVGPADSVNLAEMRPEPHK